MGLLGKILGELLVGAAVVGAGLLIAETVSFVINKKFLIQHYKQKKVEEKMSDVVKAVVSNKTATEVTLDYLDNYNQIKKQEKIKTSKGVDQEVYKGMVIND